jgi:hypothetical protein
LGIGAAVATLVAVPALALTIWGVKKHQNNNEQASHEKSKKTEEINNNETDENKNEKLLDYFINFFSNGFDYVSVTDNIQGDNVDINQVSEGLNKTFMVALGLLRCIKNNKLGIGELTKIDEVLTGVNCNYLKNDSIELIMYVKEAERKLTITKLNNNYNNLVGVDFVNTTIVLKAKQ